MPPLSSSHEGTVLEQVCSVGVPTQRKLIRFEDQVSVQVFQNATEAEKENYWIRAHDFNRIRQDCVDVVQRTMHSPRAGDPTEFRGLEHKTPIGAHHRNNNRIRARQAVLEEQRSQWEKGVNDPEYIAALYKTITHRSRVEANVMGIRDEMAARR